MKKLLIILIIMITAAAYAQYDVPAGMEERAAELFPGAKPPFRLDYKADMTLGRQGFRIINYEMVSDGKVLGTVTRLTAEHPDMKNSVDFLARFGSDGTVTGIIPFYKDDKEKEELLNDGVNLLTGFYTGKKPSEFQIMGLVLANGLAMAEDFHSVKKIQPKPAGEALDLSQKILTPGAPLSALSFESLDGKKFSAKGYNGPLVLVFVNSNCQTCLEMISATKLADEKAGKGKTQIIFVISDKAERAQTFASQAGLDGYFVTSDSGNLISKALKVPFKPYALMYDKGELKMNTPWEDESKYLGLVFTLLGIE